MPRKPQQLAKLSRPRLYDALPRERLFALLDEKRRHPAIWIVGPPGAGKTTLIGSYVQVRRQKAVWYQIDPEDSEISTFFYFLAQACAFSAGSSRNPLPRPGPESFAKPSVFSRRFFRELFSRYSGLIVLDNFQEIAHSQDVLDALAASLSEIPEGSSLVLISRADPPPRLVHQTASQQVAIIGWHELRFDSGETRAVLGNLADRTEIVEQIHSSCGGWAAGIVLMRETLQRDVPGMATTDWETRSGVFDYFTTQIFERLDDEEKAVMLRTAVLPYFSPVWACELVGMETAHNIVERLYRRHFFINRRDQGSYQYHSLFREFLLFRVERALGIEEIGRLRERGAALLESVGDFDAAFTLRIASGNWIAARRLATEQAASLLGAGRWQSLLQWLDALRPADFEADAWLVYWRGLATLAIDAAAARKILERAHAKFSATGSRTGELQSLSHILGSYFLEWDTVDTMDPWIAAAQTAILDDRPVSEESLARAYANLVVALLYRQPQNPMLHMGARFVAERLGKESDTTNKLRMAMFLEHYYDLMGEHPKAAHAIATAEHLLARNDVDPLTAVVGFMRCAHHFSVVADFERALAAADRCIAMARDYGFADGVMGFLLICRAHVLLYAQMPKEAQKELEEARRLVDAERRMIFIYLHWCEFWCASLLGDRSQLHLIWSEFARIPPAGVPVNTAYNQPVISFLADEGRFEEALERIVRWREGLAGMGSPFLEFNLDLMEASIEIRRGTEEAALVPLRKALGTGALRGFVNTLAWMPDVMSELCAFALKHDIEPDYVRQLVTRRGLAAPDRAADTWPWPVRIYALGRFDIYIDGRLLVFSGRPQHRTMELLRAIVAYGGRSVSAARITSMLWPDADGDAAQRAFSVALHRLRRLLGPDGIVQLNDGALSLDRSRCWVDSMVFEDLTQDGRLPSDAEVDAHYERLIILYRGHMLDGDDAPWVFPRRRALQARFQEAVGEYGTILERQGEWERAVSVYRAALERDSLVEELYRRIMVCHGRHGRHAEAVETYRRCREILSIVLGVAPSPETQSLFRSLQAAGMSGISGQP